MNFKDLAERLHAIEMREDDNTVAPDSSAGAGDSSMSASVEECGDMPIAIAQEKSSQSDSVTMNVSMNGSGAGGIKSLMDILRNIESGEETAPDTLIAKPPSAEYDDDVELITGDDAAKDFEEEYGNSMQGASDQHTYGIDAVTPTGDDMHSKGGESPKVNGGGNPQIHEAMVDRLQNLYNEIKGRALNEGCNEDPHRHALANIIASHKKDVNDFHQSGRLNPELYEKLYDYFFDGMGYREKKHDDHEVRHAHVAHHFKHAMATPECVAAMNQYGGAAPVVMAPALAQVSEDHDIEFE